MSRKEMLNVAEAEAEQPNWYARIVEAALRTRPDVRKKTAALLLETSREGGSEDLDDLERLIFGERIEHQPCGSRNLPGAPVCWGCEESLDVEEANG